LTNHPYAHRCDHDSCCRGRKPRRGKSPRSVWNDDFLDPFVPLPPLAERPERYPPELLLGGLERVICCLQLPLNKQLVDVRLRVGQFAFTPHLFLCALPFLDLLPCEALDFLAHLAERRRDEGMLRLKPGEARNRRLSPPGRRLTSRGFDGRAGAFVLERLCPQSRPPLAIRGERRASKLLLRRAERTIRVIELPASQQLVDTSLRCGQGALLLRRLLRALRCLGLLARHPLRFCSFSSNPRRFFPQLLQCRRDELMRRPETRQVRQRHLMPARRELPPCRLDCRACPIVF
jgi:hypothetical protein